MREWLSGGVSPCQGEGRGFESRLALFQEAEEASFFDAKARQAADELARLTSAGRKDMEHKVRNVCLRVE